MSKNKTIKVDYLARVEGEGGLYLKVKNNVVEDVQLRIFEPPRFFEAFLRGRLYSEAPDITARICGICPVAYQMSSVRAMEDIFGVNVDGQLRALRRLLYFGEWIESHTLHVFMLHAPDFLGYQDAIQMAADYPDVVTSALRMKKLGNEIMTVVGGREIHPINMRVGGFYKVPSKKQLLALADELKWARETAIKAVKLTSTLQFPDFDQEYEFVALRHPDEYPLFDGRLVSNKGLNISICDYEEHFQEEHVQHANALHSRHIGHGSYFVGPLARFDLNFSKLTQTAQDIACEVGICPKCNNPFKSIAVRSIELVHAIEESLQIIEQYEAPEKPFVDYEVKAGIGHGISEAPRGILYHRYEVDDNGIIQSAKIVPPTSQNQKTIERDLANYVPKFLDLPDDRLTWECEQAIRNYDPCISCATHFINLKVDRS